MCERLRQHGEVAALELIADVGETQERFGGGAGGCGEEVAGVERIITADAYEQVRRVRRQASKLLAHVPRRAPVDGYQRRFRAVGQPLPYLANDVGVPRHISGVVEDRIAQKHNMTHESIVPQRVRKATS